MFDEDIKSFVYSLEGSAEKTRMQLPSDTKRGCKSASKYLIEIDPSQEMGSVHRHQLIAVAKAKSDERAVTKIIKTIQIIKIIDYFSMQLT